MNKLTFWFPYKRCSVIEAINSHAAATGSPQYAKSAEASGSVGHSARMSLNERRNYWIAEYSWAGRVVISRGTFDEVLNHASEWFRSSGPISSLRVTCETQEQADACKSLGMVPWTTEIMNNDYTSFAWWSGELSTAFWIEKHCGRPAVHALATSKNLKEYLEKLNALRAEKEATV